METQTAFIIRAKELHGEELFNKNASFLMIQPYFKVNSVGLRKDELLRGVYLTLLNKDMTPMYNGDIFYIRRDLDFMSVKDGKYQIALQVVQEYSLTPKHLTFTHMPEKKEYSIIKKRIATSYIKGDVYVGIEHYDKRIRLRMGEQDESFCELTPLQFDHFVEIISQIKKDVHEDIN